MQAQACFVSTYVCAAFAHGMEFVQRNSSRMQLLNNLSWGMEYMYRVAKVPPPVQSTCTEANHQDE